MLSDKLIQQAINEAKKSNMLQKHGAIIIYRNKVVSRGHNHFIKYRRYKNGKYKSIHAEIMAIRDLPSSYIISKCKMIVVRFISGHMRLSLPCKHCQKIIKKHKVLAVYHS
tara:strand:- start:289 stop:621 length:333 start_codon:yes stop_codon:yes gene_type:complete